MANNPYVNKVVYGGNTLIDLTGDTVTPQTMLAGVTAHAANGQAITGQATVPTKTSDLENDSGFITRSDLITVEVVRL